MIDDTWFHVKSEEFYNQQQMEKHLTNILPSVPLNRKDFKCEVLISMFPKMFDMPSFCTVYTIKL